MAGKITKQELKEPDKLQTLFGEIIVYYEQKKRQLAIAAGIVVFIVLAGTGWYFYQKNEESNAFAQYNKATEEYFKARADGKDAASQTKPFADVVKNYSGTRAAAFSLYRMGNINLGANNIDGALKAYQDYLNQDSSDNELRVFVYNGLGYCYEAKKDYKGALGYFEKAVNSNAGRNFESTGFENMARTYENLNDPKKALEYYKKAVEKTVEPSMKELLNRKISSLG